RFTADLVIEMEAAPDPVQVGQKLTYRIVVTNQGPDTAEAVTVADSLPFDTTFVSATASQGSCDMVAGVLICDLDDVAAGDRVAVTIVVSADAFPPGETLVNRASVAASGDESDPKENNRAITITGVAEGRGAKEEGPLPIPALLLSGTVSSTEGTPLPGASVSVEIGGKIYSALSDAKGGYRVEIPGDFPVPDQLIIRADKEGYNTSTSIVKREEFPRADIRLSKVSKDVLPIDASLHHLGNGHYQGAINSRFQKPEAEATDYTREFEVPEDRLSASSAIGIKLRLTVKGAEEENPILINGKKVGTLNASHPDGSATVVEIPIDPCALKPGKNTLEIRADGSNANGDIDDFEFANIQLLFKPGEELSPGSKELAELSSLQVMDEGFTRGLQEVSPGGKFSIEAKGKSACASLKDVALVQVYPKSKGEDAGIRVELIETGPATGVFRSERPVSVSGLGVRAGDRLVVRSGVRGTSVPVRLKKLNLEGEWESTDPGNRYRMMVRFNSDSGKYEGILTRHGEGSKYVGFSLGEHVWSARPAKDWSSVATTQKWRWGSGGVSQGSEWRSAGLDLDQSTDNRLVLSDGRVFIRVGSSTEQKEAKKPEASWTVYRLKVEKGTGVADISVIEITFSRKGDMAELSQWEYPVSHLKNETTGKILWSIGWSSGSPVTANVMTIEKSATEELARQAEELKKGGMAKPQLRGAIEEILGKGARPLYEDWQT
ncbi:MAG: DUF11 domain-containing protein, partial [Nitrospinota bacterium]